MSKNIIKKKKNRNFSVIRDLHNDVKKQRTQNNPVINSGCLNYTFQIFKEAEVFMGKKKYPFIMSATPTSLEDFFRCFKLFINVWSLEIWILSVIGLLLSFYLVFYIYNRFFSFRNAFLSSKAQLWITMINFSHLLPLSWYIDYHRELSLWSLLHQCPIALSVPFLLVELIVFYLFFRGGKNFGKRTDK